MKGSFLKRNYQLLVRSIGQEVGMYQLLMVLAIISIPAYRAILPADSVDSMWVRWGFMLYFVSVLIASIFSGKVRKVLRYISHFSMYALASWAGTLLILNAFSLPYLTAFFVVIMFAGISFSSTRSILAFSFFILAFSLVVTGFYGAPIFFPLSVLVLLIISSLLVGIRVSIQKELGRTQDLMGSIYKGAPDAIFLADASTLKILDGNDAALQMFGGQYQVDRLHREISGWLRKIMGDRHLIKGESIRDVVEIRTLEGETFWGDIAVAHVEVGSEIRLLVRISDVSEKKRVEETMRLSDYILQKIDHLVVVANADAEIIYVSPSVVQGLGYSADELLGQAWWEYRAGSNSDVEGEKDYLRSCASGSLLPRSEPYDQLMESRGKEPQWVAWRDAVTNDGLIIRVGTLNNQERKNSLVRNAIFNIAEASTHAKNSFEFYRKIYREIQKVIDTPNFYIAVYDPVENIVSFPFYTDVVNEVARERTGKQRKAGKGLTEFAIGNKVPLLASKQEILDLETQGLIKIGGQAVPESWLGVPMVHDNRVVGLITIQDYSKPAAFSTDELALVSFIANQGAQFVNKLQQDEALKTSEERFRTIYNQAAVGIASVAPHGGFIQVNQRMCDIFGYSEEELLRKMPKEIVHPLDIAVGNEDLARIHRGEIDRYSKEKRYMHKDGRAIYALLNVSAFREDGEIKFLIAVYEDITEKKRAQEETQLLLTLSTELQHAKTARDALFMGMVSIAIHGGWDYGEIWWADLGKKLCYCDCYYVSSGELEIFHEASRDIIMGQEPDYPLDWGLHNTLISWEEDLSQMKAFGRQKLALSHGFESYVLIALREGDTPLGVMVLMSKTRYPKSENHHRLFRASGSQLISVIQRKLAESAQRESEARYRTISEAAFEGIVIYRNGKMLEVNTAFARIFDYEIEEIMQKPLTALIYEEESDKWLKKISGEVAESIEFLGRKSDGSAIHLEAMGQESTWQGEPAHILAIRDITNEKLMEEAREAARIDARFRAYVQNSSEIIQIIDKDDLIAYTSPSVSRILGRNPEELVGLNYLNQYHTNDHELIEKERKKLMEVPGETSKSQLRMLHVSGDWRVVQTSLVNLMDDPLVQGILLSSRDITDVVNAQKSMIESEERFRSLFTHSPDAIFVEREDGIILDVNDAGCKLHEMTRDEIVGQHIADLAPEEDREVVMATFKRLFKGEVNYLEGTSVSRNGKVTPVEIRVTVIQFEDAKAIILQARDITERRKNELVLKESEERFRALVEHATEAIFVMDLETERFIEVNKNSEVLFGRMREELMEINPRDLNPPFQPDGSDSWSRQRGLLESASEGNATVYEWVHLNAEGKEIPCEVRLNRFPSASRVMVRGSVTNITERKLTEKRVLDSREQLRIQNEKLIALTASPAINSGDLEAAFREISQVVCETLSVHRTGIWLFDERGENLACRMEYDVRSNLFEQGRELPVRDFPHYLQVIQDERVIAAHYAREDERTREFTENYLIPANIFSVLDAPFRHDGKIAGVVWVEQFIEPKEWSLEAQNFVASMADMVTLALEAWERKKAEVELAQTLSKMRATFDSTQDGILVVDIEGRVLEYNEGFLDLSNVPAEVLQSDDENPGFLVMLEHVVDHKGLEDAMSRMEKNPETKEGYIYEVKDGRTIEVYIRPMKMDGKIRGRLWFLHDITDLKRAEAALLENETKFRALFSQANDAILVMQGAFVSECNDKALEMFGLNREQITGKALYELSPELQPDGEQSESKLPALVKRAEEGEFVSYNWKHQRANGVPFDAEVSLNRITIGERTWTQAFVRDITERIEAEGALRESELKNKAILDAIPDLMLRINTEGLVLDYKTNDREDLLNVEGTLLDRNLVEVLPASMAAQALQHMKRALATGESQQYELEMMVQGGKRDYETRLVRSGAREALIIIRDVTERKRTEKELIKRNFELDSFVYRASHDLMAPLNSLMGLIELVKNETQEVVVLQYVGMMSKGVEKLDSFIRNLADFSRNDRQEIGINEINWEILVNESLENLKFMENSERVKKVVEIKSMAPFFSDPVRLGILFNNLISNAVKYQNLENETSFVKVEILNNSREVHIRIEDNGIGIKEIHQAKVFDLFFRASIQSYGSGIGMYIVKDAVDKLKGSIKMKSKLGTGTTFTMVIPNENPNLKKKTKSIEA